MMKIGISMYPNGNKFYQVDFPGLKMFLHPYFYLMIDHFFREGQPVYDMKSMDKPNEYDTDYETYPEMHLVMKLGESLICFAEAESFQDPTCLGIVCQTSVDFQFKREHIKRIKEEIWDKL
jgi:hypothetical protein